MERFSSPPIFWVRTSLVDTCPNLWKCSSSKCYGMDCLDAYFTHWKLLTVWKKDDVRHSENGQGSPLTSKNCDFESCSLLVGVVSLIWCNDHPNWLAFWTVKSIDFINTDNAISSHGPDLTAYKNSALGQSGTIPTTTQQVDLLWTLPKHMLCSALVTDFDVAAESNVHLRRT